jgi:hypothetical protein
MPAETMMSVNTPRAAYGNINIQPGEPGAGKKNLARRSLNFFIATSSAMSRKTNAGLL